MAVKIAKVTRKVAPTENLYSVVHSMIAQAKDRATQEGGVLTPNATVKVVVEQEFLSNDD